MLRQDSPLRRLPPNLDKTQVVFLDGIRHAVEIIDLAHSRLRRTLTTIALEYKREDVDRGHLFTEAFLDAWAIVDAIDRFRNLLHLMPGVKKLPPKDGEPGFRKTTEDIRNLRNVADHLAQLADHIVARKSTALGVLSWFTILDSEEGRGLSCLIVPGTVSSSHQQVVNPADRPFNPPTDLVHLAAGKYRACLSDAVEGVRKALVPLERSLQVALLNHGVADLSSGADLLVATEMIFPPIDRST